MKPYVRLMGKIFTPIWSGNRLSEKYPRFADLKTVGECWETSVEKDSQPDIVGSSAIGFSVYLQSWDLPTPPLVKIIDAKMPLSVQVHPDETTAVKYGGISKNEFWYVLHAEPNSTILYGTVHGIKEEELMERIGNGDILPCLRAVPVKKGDTFMIPEGMIHSLGAGVTVLEVQNRMGTTYRIKDIAGDRETHIKESAASIRLYKENEAQGYAMRPHGKLSEACLPGVRLVSTPDYAVTRYAAKSASESLTIDRSGVYMFCENGSGTICGEGFCCGDSFFLGSAGCELTLVPNTSVIFVI